MDPTTSNVATPSSEYSRMCEAWTMIADILKGARAIRAKREVYLPKYQDESQAEYDRRLKAAPWRPQFADILTSLASKPFSRELALKEGASGHLKDLSEDIDARGNNLTVFAGAAFKAAIANGLHLIYVTYTGKEAFRTRAEEAQAGNRPYWVSIPVTHLLALYTEIVKGTEIVTHARWREDATERDGFGEKHFERVRVVEPGHWWLWEKAPGDKEFTVKEEGEISRAGNTSVPLVLFFTGERLGSMEVKPSLIDLAEMQIELYRALSREDEILTFAGSPMLKAKGMSPPPPDQPIAVGPKRVLFAPPGGDAETDWDFVQPDAANIEAVGNHVQKITDEMQRLGMQPLTPRSGGVTATATAVDSAEAHSAVQAWANGLKDALEQAFVFTAEWLAEDPSTEVDVSTDFAVQPFAQAPLDALDKARARKDISQRTYWGGLKRFEVLPRDFDADAEEEALADEGRGLDGEGNIDPVTGRIV